MSDEDKKTYRQLLLIAILSIFGILFLFAFGTLYAEWACFQFVFVSKPVPEGCTNGSISKFALEFVAIVVGVLGAIRILGQ
jgi:predicted membrane metal-binding protein